MKCHICAQDRKTCPCGKMPLYRAIAQALRAAESAGNNEWSHRHYATARLLVKRHMPSGAGIDSGVTLDIEASDKNRLVFCTAYHHMDEHGHYDGWTDHRIMVRASLCWSCCGLDITIGGRDRNGIKEYLHDVLHDALMKTVDAYPLADAREGLED